MSETPFEEDGTEPHYKVDYQKNATADVGPARIPMHASNRGRAAILAGPQTRRSVITIITQPRGGPSSTTPVVLSGTP